MKLKENDRYRGDAKRRKCFAESGMPQPTYGISKGALAGLAIVEGVFYFCECIRLTRPNERNVLK